MGDAKEREDDVGSAATHYAPGPATAVTPSPGAPAEPTPGVETVAGPSHPSLAPSTQAPATASRALLAGRYELFGLLGAGGMGSVYKAKDLELDELVALKLLRRDLVGSPGMLERFRREVKLARRVTHANVARVFDIGEHGDDHFLTMEFVDGESLANVLARTGALPIGRALELACAVLAGLGAAHAAGIVHRDLKPDNVLVARDGRVVVTDFGIARLAEPDSSQTMGAFVGTPAYMAPEQVEGGADLDARADVYAFGAMFYELLTGARPWVGEGPIAVAAARLLNPPPDPRLKRPDMPTACAEVVLKCMARKREDRFGDAASIVAELSLVTMPAPPTTLTPSFGLRPSAAAPQPKVVVVDEQRTVAVLPFRNGGKPEDDYLADELTDDLIDSLSMTKGLKVRPRGVVQKYRAVACDPCEVGRDLGVSVVVEGSARKAGGNVRISARVLSVADGFQLWAKRFDRPEGDVLAINDEVSTAVAGALTVAANANPRAAPSDPAAIDFFLRGRHEYRKFWPDPVRASIELFDKALALAPSDPVILSSAALARARLAFFSGEGLAEAVALSERAVALAPNLGEARLARGNVVFQLGDTAAALRELKMAIARSPGLAEAHASLGRILIELGDLDEGVRRLETALELDSHVPLAATALARVFAITGDWHRVEAMALLSAVTDGVASSHTLRARLALWKRDIEAARATLLQIEDMGLQALVSVALLELVVRRKVPDFLTLVPQNHGRPQTLPGASNAATLRRNTFFMQITAETQMFLGDREAAVAALANAVDNALIDLLWLERCPLWDDELRAMPLYQSSLARMRRRCADLLDAYRAS